MIPQSEIKEILHYDPNTGAFTWKISCRGRKSNGEAGSLSDGYLLIWIKGKNYKAHHLAWLITHGIWPKTIDHINHNKSDNRIFNLRETTTLENSRNKPLGRNNKFGLFGLKWRSGYWEACIGVKGCQIYLGVFADKFEAICARKSAENKYGFHANHGYL